MEPRAETKVGRLIAATRDADLVRQLKEMEPRSTFGVECISSGLALAKRVPSLGWWEPPAVLLVDDDLDDMPGRSLVPHIHKLRADLKVIFLAADPTPELEVEVRRNGAYTFMAKPATPELLMKIVEKAVDHTSRLVRPAPGKKRIGHG